MNRRIALTLALAVALSLALFGTAAAHAELESSTPADGANLTAAPSKITLVLSEEVSDKETDSYFVVTDEQGVPLAAALSAANVAEGLTLPTMVEAAQAVLPEDQNIEAAHADKAYDHRANRIYCRVNQLRYNIPVRGHKETALGRKRWVIERTFAFIGGLISGREDTRQLSGPIGIAKASGEWATLGLAALITLGAYLSASIGLLNLFPIPMLDGGHLMFYGIEAVRRKPMGEQAQEVALRIGLALVLSLMLFATWNDLMRIFWS